MNLEFISYPFFKTRLKKKMAELYQNEDPWGSTFLSEVFEPWIRERHADLSAESRHAPVLDAGGGEGHYIMRLQDVAPAFHLVDIQAEAIQRAEKKLSAAPCKFFIQSLDQFKPRQPEYYGAIWCFSILTFLGAAKHPDTAQAILTKLWKALKRGGILLAIHPFYSNAEKEYLIFQLTQLSGKPLIQETRQVNQQNFLLQAVQKD